MKKDEGIILRGFKQGDEKQIAHLFFNNFPDTLIPDNICKTWLWQFRNDFSKPSCVSVAELSSEIVAHYAVMWFPMCCHGTKIEGAISTATVTDVKARGKGLFTKLANKVFKETRLDKSKIIFGFPNSQSIRGFIKYLEWFEIAKFPLLIKPVNFSPFLSKFARFRMASAFFASVLNCLYPFCFKLIKGFEWGNPIKIRSDVKNFSNELTRIWQSCFASDKIAIIRDPVYLKWRYLDKPFSEYDIFMAEDENNKPVGVMVTAVTEKKGLKVVYVMDMLVMNEKKQVYKKFLSHLDLYAKKKGADAVSMLCLPNNPNKWLFYKHGFLPVPKKMFPQDIHFCARANSQDIDKDYIKDGKNWYITWGDLDIV